MSRSRLVRSKLRKCSRSSSMEAIIVPWEEVCLTTSEYGGVNGRDEQPLAAISAIAYAVHVIRERIILTCLSIFANIDRREPVQTTRDHSASFYQPISVAIGNLQGLIIPDPLLS